MSSAKNRPRMMRSSVSRTPVARVEAEILHLSLPQSPCIRLCPARDDEGSSVTATMKVRRASVYKTYGEEIEALYR